MGKNIGTALVLGLIALVIHGWREEHGMPNLPTVIKQDMVANGTIKADPTPVAPEAKPAAIAAKPKASKPSKARKSAPSQKSKAGVAYTDNAASWGGK